MEKTDFATEWEKWEQIAFHTKHLRRCYNIIKWKSNTGTLYGK